MGEGIGGGAFSASARPGKEASRVCRALRRDSPGVRRKGLRPWMRPSTATFAPQCTTLRQTDGGECGQGEREAEAKETPSGCLHALR